MLIIGCGYLGRRLAARLASQQTPVTGLVRTQKSAEALESLGLGAIVADLDQRLPALPGDFGIFYFAAPPSSGRIDPRMGRFLNALRESGGPRKLVYLSTTGVYGDCAGKWVDENRQARPTVDRARRRWDAEEQLRAWQAAGDGDLVILRVAGIYGPGRLPLERLRAGRPMVSEQEAPWTNRIHVDDLVTTCIAAMERGKNNGIYNVSDGNPGNMADYFNRVADLTGLPRPPVVNLDESPKQLSAGLLSYLHESRRLSNHKMREELHVNLRYPTLESGLPAALAES